MRQSHIINGEYNEWCPSSLHYHPFKETNNLTDKQILAKNPNKLEADQVGYLQDADELNSGQPNTNLSDRLLQALTTRSDPPL